MKIITEGKEPRSIVCAVEYGDGTSDTLVQARGIDALTLIATLVGYLIRNGMSIQMIMAAVTAGAVHSKDGDEE